MVKDFARSVRPARIVSLAGRRAALGLLCCYMIVTVGGCSTPGWIKIPLGGGEPRQERAENLNPKQISDALLFAGEKMRLHPDEPYWPFRLAELYTAADSTTRAMAFLDYTLDLDSGHAPAATLLSKHHYELQDYDAGIDLLEDFVSRNNDAPDAVRAALALHLEAVGDVAAAHAVLKQCRSSSQEVRAAQTFVSLRDDDTEAAIVAAKRALDSNSRSGANHNNYGIALLLAGRPGDARESFLDALELDNELPGALYNMAIVETFYFFDEAKGRTWFIRYKQYASADPDDLASVFGADLTENFNAKK
jgi:tetratricopeptide (TPR) repeat protein